MPEATPIWDYLNEQLRKKHLLQEPGVEALQLLNVEEIEILEAILRQGHSQLELLRQRMADPERRHISMKNFLIARLEERGVKEYLLGQYRELGEHITALLFGERN